MKPRRSRRTGSASALALVALLVAGPATAQREVPAPSTPRGGARGTPGTLIETFPTGNPNGPGLAIDGLDPSRVFLFSQDSTGNLYELDVGPGHVVTSTPVEFQTSDHDSNGGTVRPADGFIYTADFNGDLRTLDDNVHLFDPDGSLVAYWELDAGLHGPICSGGSVDGLMDVTRTTEGTGILYATAYPGSLIFRLDLRDESGGAGANSPCSISVIGTTPAPIVDVAGIEYDACNDGFWLSDFESDAVVLVANDGTFSTILVSFNGDAGFGFSSGITPVEGDPIQVWVTDNATNTVAVFDSGTSGSGCDAAPPAAPPACAFDPFHGYLQAPHAGETCLPLCTSNPFHPELFGNVPCLAGCSLDAAGETVGDCLEITAQPPAGTGPDPLAACLVHHAPDECQPLAGPGNAARLGWSDGAGADDEGPGSPGGGCALGPGRGFDPAAGLLVASLGLGWVRRRRPTES